MFDNNRLYIRPIHVCGQEYQPEMCIHRNGSLNMFLNQESFISKFTLDLNGRIGATVKLKVEFI